MFILHPVPAPVVFPVSDLAPGDLRSATLNLSAFQFDRIRAFDDPLFESGYAQLWGGVRREQ
jgi:hypothetical protein